MYIYIHTYIYIYLGHVEVIEEVHETRLADGSIVAARLLLQRRLHTFLQQLGVGEKVKVDCAHLALLGLELSPDPCSLALLREDGQLATRQFGGERGRALLHEIDGLMREAGTERAELRGIVVGIGPGSYTGLRIACTAARSLAYALEIPVGGISSFDAAIAEAGEGITHVVLDAYRGEVYHGTGACAQGEVRITQEPRVCQLELARCPLRPCSPPPRCFR